jgi:hypothetical protein
LNLKITVEEKVGKQTVKRCRSYVISDLYDASKVVDTLSEHVKALSPTGETNVIDSDDDFVKIPKNRHERPFIGQILEKMGAVFPHDVDWAIGQQLKGDKQRLGEILMKANLCTQIDVAYALAEQFEMEFVDLPGTELREAVVELLPVPFCKENNIVAFDLSDQTLVVAVSDPVKTAQIADTVKKMVAPLNVDFTIATESAIANAIAAHIPQ